MQKLTFFGLTLVLLAFNWGLSLNKTNSQCVKQLYAAPANKWGSPVQIQSCFGEKVGCKFSVAETPIEAPIRFQVKADQKGWVEYKEGDWIEGQTIMARAASTLTGGYVKILCQCSCDCD